MLERFTRRGFMELVTQAAGALGLVHAGWNAGKSAEILYEPGPHACEVTEEVHRAAFKVILKGKSKYQIMFPLEAFVKGFSANRVFDDKRAPVFPSCVSISRVGSLVYSMWVPHNGGCLWQCPLGGEICFHPGQPMIVEASDPSDEIIIRGYYKGM